MGWDESEKKIEDTVRAFIGELDPEFIRGFLGLISKESSLSQAQADLYAALVMEAECRSAYEGGHLDAVFDALFAGLFHWLQESITECNQPDGPELESSIVEVPAWLYLAVFQAVGELVSGKTTRWERWRKQRAKSMNHWVRIHAAKKAIREGSKWTDKQVFEDAAALLDNTSMRTTPSGVEMSYLRWKDRVEDRPYPALKQLIKNVAAKMT